VKDERFEVLAQTQRGQTAYVVVGPTGPLYSFGDAGDAAAEVAVLNESPNGWHRRRGSGPPHRSLLGKTVGTVS
jgi:hypothetical protein